MGFICFFFWCLTADIPRCLVTFLPFVLEAPKFGESAIDTGGVSCTSRAKDKGRRYLQPPCSLPGASLQVNLLGGIPFFCSRP